MPLFKKDPSRTRQPLLGPGSTFVGRLWRGVARGALEGLPVVGPAIGALRDARPGEAVRPVARFITSNFVIFVFAWLLIERILGNVSFSEVLGIVSKFFFLF